MKTLLIGILISTVCRFGLNAQSAEQRKDLENNWEKFVSAWEKEDAETCASFFLEDGKNFPPQSEKPIKGRMAIQGMYKNLFEENKSSNYDHKIHQVEQIGDYLLEEGFMTVDWVRNDDSTWQFKAKTITLWKKDGNSGYRIAKFIFN